MFEEHNMKFTIEELEKIAKEISDRQVYDSFWIKRNGTDCGGCNTSHMLDGIEEFISELKEIQKNKNNT